MRVPGFPSRVADVAAIAALAYSDAQHAEAMKKLSSADAGSHYRARSVRGGPLRLLRLLWPPDEPGFRIRMAATVALLAGAALLNAAVPMLFAAAIDHL